ncbi:hypothetical protein D9619_006344 [Psilocybe cf. subviscida]|uniref:Uncharacterized protein n=1 Tax=Psilocybe cf. subviscida TaxID=2480587 RepID=A0A8H5B4E9_9AGAR|nr:hypothetical protein D9619_006344 [Psilocybe cf. subviscida]
MNRVKIIEARKAALADSERRYTEAELVLKAKQPELAQKTEHVKKLEENIRLATECKQLVRDLTKTLEKLDKAKKDLAATTERLERVEKKVTSFRDEADTFESKYQTTKKEYNAFMTMVDTLEL